MENYKVKVGSEAESKEAHGLFFELGGGWGNVIRAGLAVKILPMCG